METDIRKSRHCFGGYRIPIQFCTKFQTCSLLRLTKVRELISILFKITKKTEMCTVTLIIIQIGFEWYQLKDNFVDMLGIYFVDLIAKTNTPAKQIQGYPPPQTASPPQ